MKKEREFTNPFSEDFLPTWQLWKDFRKEEHNFAYKGVISEQMAINRLVEVAEGDEDIAKRIISQSISRCWMDFYKLKQPSNNGKSAAKQPTTKAGTDSLRSQSEAEFIRRNVGGEQQAGSDHLKAV